MLVAWLNRSLPIGLLLCWLASGLATSVLAQRPTTNVATTNAATTNAATTNAANTNAATTQNPSRPAPQIAASIQALSSYPYPGPPPPEYGRLTSEAFVITSADSNDHPYRYLYRGMDVRFELQKQQLQALITYHIRLRVQQASGVLASYIQIPLYVDNNLETLEYIEGNTWEHPSRAHPLDPEARRLIRVNERYSMLEFTMPQVKPGTILEYRYTIRRRYIEELPDFPLMMEQPVDLAQVRLINSTFVRYHIRESQPRQALAYYETKADTGRIRTIFRGRSAEPLLIQSWQASQIPALREEPLSGSLDQHRWKMRFQWSEFGNPRQYLENGWELVAAGLRRREGLFDNITGATEARALGAQLGASIPDQTARMEYLFKYVRDKAVMSVHRGITDTDDPSKVLKGEAASPALINQVLIAVLQGAGLEAWPVLATSRDFGRIEPHFPSIYAFNRVLVGVRIGQTYHCLDGSQRWNQAFIVPEEVLHTQGLWVTDQQTQWIPLATPQSRSARQIYLKGEIDTRGLLKGELNSFHRGYEQLRLLQRREQQNDPFQVAEELLFRNTGRVRYLSGHFVEQADQSGFQLSLEIPSYGLSFRDGLEIYPLLIGAIEQNPLISDQRSLPLQQPVPESLVFEAELRVPRGYRMPKAEDRMEVSRAGARLMLTYTQTGDLLRYRVEMDMPSLMLPADQVGELRDFYAHWLSLSQARWFLQRRSAS